MKKIAPIMAELGFCALHNGLLSHADQIFDVLTEMNPEDAAGAIGQATVQLSGGDIRAAISTLEKGMMAARLNRHEASKLLLIAYMLEGDDAKAEQLHRQFVIGSGCPASEAQLERAGHFFNQIAA